jgi:hypothetical protein
MFGGKLFLELNWYQSVTIAVLNMMLFQGTRNLELVDTGAYTATTHSSQGVKLLLNDLVSTVTQRSEHLTFILNSNQYVAIVLQKIHRHCRINHLDMK